MSEAAAAPIQRQFGGLKWVGIEDGTSHQRKAPAQRAGAREEAVPPFSRAFLRDFWS